MREEGVFMEPETITQDATTQDDNAQTQDVQDNGAETSTQEDKAQKTVEKLQKRLGQLAGAKNSAEKEAEELRARNAELENLINDYKQGKSVKELSEKEKAEQEAQAKDDEIKSLKAQIARNQALTDTNEVLREQGYNVPKNVLDLIVSDDSEKTLANTNALLDFIEQEKQNVRMNMLKGTTPTKTGAPVKRMTKQQIMAISNDAERQRAIADNIELFTN